MYLNAGTACRYKAGGALQKRFVSPKEAEAYFLRQSPVCDSQMPTSSSECETFSDFGIQTDCISTYNVACQTELSILLSDFEDGDLVVMSKIFSDFLRSEQIFIPDDYLTYSARAMKQLLSNNRSPNIIYNLVKSIGTIREDGSDSCFPCKRMPMGMLEYTANFFSRENIQQVKYTIMFNLYSRTSI